jgi:hypothetical protein
MISIHNCNNLLEGKIINEKIVASEKTNNIKCIAAGACKKCKGGTIGNSLSSSHNFDDIIFAINQKMQMILVTIIFFETIDKLEIGIKDHDY